MPRLARSAHRWPASERDARHAGSDDAALRSVRTQPRPRGADRIVAIGKPIAEELRRVVGREAVIDSPNDLRIFERDGSIEGAIPDAVVLASSTDEVARVMKVAAKHGVPVVPRGAGTGLSGG